MAVRYRRLVLRVEADADLLTAALWDQGTLGVELAGEGRMLAYFQADSVPAIDWAACGARLESDEFCSSQDWMSAYRAAARPLTIGERLIVDPREPEHAREEPAYDPERRLLRLPARTAFGTGSHASTRLAIELMERLDFEGLEVLDVGVGSGILSFAALLFGARRVVGVEIDAAALLVAEQNRALNELHPSWLAGGVEALAAPGRFDAALVNVLPERIADDLETIRELLAPGGRAIFSGIVAEAETAVAAGLEAAGFLVEGRRADDGWTAFVVRRTAADGSAAG